MTVTAAGSAATVSESDALYSRALTEFYVLREKMKDILQKFSTESDTLSNELTSLGKEIVKIVLPLKIEDVQGIKDNLKANINKLAAILVNPLDRAQLKLPILASDDQVWEEWVLKDFQRLSKLSPFDGKELSATKVHEFAIAILAWLPTASSFITGKSDSMAIIAFQSAPAIHLIESPEVKDTGMAMCQHANYHALAKKALTLKKLMALQAMMQSSGNVFSQATQIIVSGTKADLAKAAAAAAAIEQKITESVQEMSARDKRTAEMLGVQLDKGNNHLQTASTDLTAAQTRSRQLAAELRSLGVNN